jgi:hypothetical protein
MAKAATLTIVEAENIVPVGSIDPNDVDLPGIFVDRIVPATSEKHIEILKLREAKTEGSESLAQSPAITERNRIAKRAAKELKQGYYVNLGVGVYSEPRSMGGANSSRNSYPRTLNVARGSQSMDSIREWNSRNGNYLRQYCVQRELTGVGSVSDRR